MGIVSWRATWLKASVCSWELNTFMSTLLKNIVWTKKHFLQCLFVGEPSSPSYCFAPYQKEKKSYPFILPFLCSYSSLFLECLFFLSPFSPFPQNALSWWKAVKYMLPSRLPSHSICVMDSPPTLSGRMSVPSVCSFLISLTSVPDNTVCGCLPAPFEFWLQGPCFVQKFGWMDGGTNERMDEQTWNVDSLELVRVYFSDKWWSTWALTCRMMVVSG